MEVVQKKYNQTKYNHDFMAKHKDKKYVCNICNKEYSYYSKSQHIKTQYHKLAEKFRQEMVN